MNMDTSSKVSLAATLLILTGFGAFGWDRQQRIKVLEKEREGLRSELGIAPDNVSPDRKARPGKVVRETRGDRDMAAFAARLIPMLKKMEIDEEEDEDVGNRILDEMEGLTPGEANALVAAFGPASGLNEEIRQAVLSVTIISLGENHPEESLSMLARSSDLSRDGHIEEEFISATLRCWATTNPAAARAWLDSNVEQSPELLDDEAKIGLLTGTALADPKLAFRGIGHMEITDGEEAISRIMSAGTNAEERGAIVSALRDEVANSPDEDTKAYLVETAFGNLARQVMDVGFKDSRGWLDELKPSPEEMEAISSGVLQGIASDEGRLAETGAWLEWMGRGEPEEGLAEKLRLVATQWTRKDYRAVEKWLEKLPEGPLREIASEGYQGGMSDDPESTGGDFEE